MTDPDILAIVGSVSFACPDAIHVVHQIIGDELAWRRPDEVTSGGADGVDTAAEQIAAEFNIPTPHIFRPTARRWHGPGGFKERNQRIADTCTRALRIVCAQSKTYGSGWMVDEAQRQGKPVRRVVIAADGAVTDSGWPA